MFHPKTPKNTRPVDPFAWKKHKKVKQKPLALGPQSPQPLLQFILVLGCDLGRRLSLSGRRLIQLLVELDARIVSQLAEEFVDRILGHLRRGGLRKSVLVDAVRHGVFFVLFLEVFENAEALLHIR